MEWTRPLPPPSLLPCKRPLPRYKSDPVVEPPPKCVRFDLDILLDEDIVMNNLTPIDPSTGVPQLEQKTPDNQGEPEAEAPDSQNDRREVVASVLEPEQLTEVHHEPEQETELHGQAVGTRDNNQELVRPNAPMVNSLTGALQEAGRESENVDTENDGQEVARVVQTTGAQENELEVLTPMVLEESQRPDAVEVVPESNAIGPPELKQTTDSEHIPHSHERKDAVPQELNMEVARAAGSGMTILTSKPQKPQRSSEHRSAMTREHISTPETNIETIDNRIAVMKEEYVKTSDELVHNVPSPQSLEKSCITLHKFCRTELHNSSPGIVVPARLDFKAVTDCNNDLCDTNDKAKVDTLHSTLVEMVEELCADFPRRCAKTALKWNQPITENAIIYTEVLSSESFERLSQSAVQMMSSQASDRKSMVQIINRMKQTGQAARALVEQQTKESDARFIEKLNSSQHERRGSHSNNSVARDPKECEHEVNKNNTGSLSMRSQAASKQHKVRDQGLTMQQQQWEAVEVQVELEQQQKRQEEALRLWRVCYLRVFTMQRCDKPQQLKRQQWEEQMATKQEVANEKERERLEQEATNQEHERERERLKQEAANQEHERERLTRHHQEHEADDLNCQQQNQEAANEEWERLAQQQCQTQQITKSFQVSAVECL
ncbi:hypothetical protein EDB89DRAFT_1990765 [Lactarius sanguifluus]|nr:hypothetical protein EDB89DRAFT_1990765 [Lactarius sanguifluus]